MKELPDLNKNNQPVQVMIFNGPVNLVQANGSTVTIETLSKKKKNVAGKIIKAISSLATTAMLLFK